MAAESADGRALGEEERGLLAYYDIDRLHSIQHIANLKSIAKHGILSRNRIAALQLRTVDISDPDVQRGRSEWLYGGRPLHDYVPLFFRALTPMQYVVCIKQGRRDEVAVLEIDVEVFAVPGVIFTDGNARASETRVFGDLNALAELDWEALNTPDAWSREYKLRKSAEILVPDTVPPGLITRVCFTHAGVIPSGLKLACERDESVFP
ncbi:MAG: hypothetical protein A2148_03055 [Chloroflexi bacterium RBG_16_68_14]|nr:MAG: hypothetical protein A2148_03055 [Chloroflexi bacterium RBG_16_68_14]